MSQPSEVSSDAALIAQTLEGHDSAFVELVARHKRLVLGIVGRFGSSSEDVDDMAQEVFLQAYRALPRYRHEAPFSHWLSRIAIRKAYEFLRKSRKRQGDVALEEALEHCDPSAPDPQRTSTIEWVRNALARLAPKEQLVLVLLELQGYSIRDVALRTGWSEANVKVRAHRARNALKLMLTQIDQ
jgi:RNA polymerase sigma-70 factor (ECF subfamily)